MTDLDHRSGAEVMGRRVALKILGAGVVLGGLDGSVVRGRPAAAATWDDRTEPIPLVGHTRPVLAASFDRAGERVATGGYDRELAVWDAATGVERLTVLQRCPIHCIPFSPDGTMVAAGSSERKVATRRERGPAHPLIETRRPRGPSFHYEGGAIQL